MPNVYRLNWAPESTGEWVPLDRAHHCLPLKGATGLDMPPVLLTTQQRNAGDGAVLLNTSRPSRPIFLPVLLTADDDGHVRQTVNRFARLFSEPGRLRVDDGYGARELRDVHYEGGLEGNESIDASLVATWRKAGLLFRALDPWWYDTDDLGGSLGLPSGGFSESAAETRGDVGSYPVFTIPGPFNIGTKLEWRTSLGATLSPVWEIAKAIGNGDTLVIDHRPGATFGPYLNGTLDWSYLTTATRLRTLPVPTDDGQTIVLRLTSPGGGLGNIITYITAARWYTP